MVSDNSSLVLEPSDLMRCFTVLMAVFGVLFGAIGLVAALVKPWSGPGGGDGLGGALMVVFGVFFAVLMGAATFASVRCDPSGVRYRYGWMRLVAVADIRSIDVGPGSGGYYSVREYLCIHVTRKSGKPMKLSAFQAIATDGCRARLEARAMAMASILGVPPAGAHPGGWPEAWSAKSA